MKILCGARLVAQHLQETLIRHLLLPLILNSRLRHWIVSSICIFKVSSVSIHQGRQFGPLGSSGRNWASRIVKVRWVRVTAKDCCLCAVLFSSLDPRHALLLDYFKEGRNLLVFLDIACANGTLCRDIFHISNLLQSLAGSSWWRIAYDFDCLLLNVDVKMFGQLVDEFLVLHFLWPSDRAFNLSFRQAFAMTINCWNLEWPRFGLGSLRLHSAAQESCVEIPFLALIPEPLLDDLWRKTDFLGMLSNPA